MLVANLAQIEEVVKVPGDVVVLRGGVQVEDVALGELSPGGEFDGLVLDLFVRENDGIKVGNVLQVGSVRGDHAGDDRAVHPLKVLERGEEMITETFEKCSSHSPHYSVD